ncbi:hypothetical protein B0H67DRAFT_582425 [Lasiosphaeris hirsuta]|uniref:SET domain-containing protein n=1 Tax=Lasiosphaeris hirsuta TaxID=260670 RepID=A0AA40DTV7_9PEZI|nr:hypothetical protein B0H67DRAFT_582425 [Lasiosphaeris hirsuta]
MMDIDGGAGAEFVESTRNFLQWFQSLPGATFHQNIRIEDLRERGAGRGIIATADIEPDTVLFTIPRQAILCAETSDLATKLPALFAQDASAAASDDNDGDDSKSQDGWTLLILMLIHEALQGSASRWKPYLDILPRRFDTPMFWPALDLAELQASDVVAKIGKADADAMIRTRILPTIHANSAAFFPAGTAPLSDEDLWELAHRMGSTIMAYAFDLESDDAPSEKESTPEDDWVEDHAPPTILGMVPLADLLNADATFNAHINHSPAALTAVALRAVPAGTEILNYYGPLPNSELLRRYGYVTPAHARHDVVELPWALIQSHLRAPLRALSDTQWAAATASVEDADDTFVLERATDDPDATGQIATLATFAGLPEELTDAVKTFLKGVLKAAPRAAAFLEDKTARKAVILEGVHGALGEREGQYATTLEEDDALLGNGARGRKEMAVWVRRGEKNLLREAREWVAGQLDEARRAGLSRGREYEEGDGQAAKRRRR